MSISIYLYIKTGDHSAQVAEVGNYTHNCQPMWTLALRSVSPDDLPAPTMLWWSNHEARLCDFDGMPAEDAIPLLKWAVAHMDNPANEEQYTALNPSNGWGNFKSAREYLRKFLAACQEHYLATIEVSC